MTTELTRRSAPALGHLISYQEAGPASGDEPIVLLHGLASDSDTWDRAALALAERGYRVLAVDLIGHGRSDKPRGTYLLDDFAASLAAFLDAVDIPSATLCGHSLGGAVAVHFAARFPERVRRLVLVSAGGLGREVHPVLRAASRPLAPVALRLVLHPRLVRWYARPVLHRTLRLTPDNLTNLRRAQRALGAEESRAAFFAALRGVIDRNGQRGSFLEMRTLAEHVPTMLVWNEKDPVIPVAHARAAHEQLPGSRLVVFPGAGHEPHRRNAARFADEVTTFITSS